MDLTIDLSSLCVCASCLTQEQGKAQGAEADFLGAVLLLAGGGKQKPLIHCEQQTPSSQVLHLLLGPVQKKIILKMQSWGAWVESEALYNTKKVKKHKENVVEEA